LPLLATAAWRAQPALMAACRQLDVGVLLRPLAPFGFSDAVPFVESGLPLVASLTDPAEKDFVHTLDDTADRLDPARLAAAARALIAIAVPALG
ncbi:MAG: M28 family peptidase, partial [Deltaproteobacteria bacterium]|nr:M28 family peptidase [Deltaproteobacteria bacterium]